MFLPAELLATLAPWNASAPADLRPTWNPLAYDAIGQFFPWRSFAADALRQGTLPLWNPYVFCGAPFVANSQSAVFYPPNLLFVMLPVDRAFAIVATFHLVLAACGMWLLLRALGAGTLAGIVAGLVFAFCTWQVSWLQLPTFLDTSCWLPFAVLATVRLFRKPSPGRALSLAAIFAMMLLAGHLQIAFYVGMAAGLGALYLLALRSGVRRGAEHSGKAASAEFSGQGQRWRTLGWWLFALLLGGLIAAPQLLPSVELSNRSHRAAPPTSAGYAAYIAYAVPPQSLATLFQPDLFGNPSQPDLPYVGLSQGGFPFNYAEGALYVSVGALLLAAMGVTSHRHRKAAGFFGAAALLALLMALGTPIDAWLYFHVPGFGRSGAPGRSLVLWAFSMAALAGFGLDDLARGGIRLAKALGAVIAVAGLWAGALAYCVGMPGAYPPIDAHLVRQIAFFVASAAAVLLMAVRSNRWAGWAVIGLIAADLLWQGAGYNSVAPRDQVYPKTSVIVEAGRLAGHDRIAPINQDWSFRGPRAVFPPNAAMVYRLHDVQGYDSLFPGRYKDFMNRVAGNGQDASPVQVGNMVFAKDPYSPLLPEAGVRVILSLEPLNLPGSQETYADGVYMYTLSGVKGRAWAECSDGEQAWVRWQEDGINRIRLEARSPSPGVLHLADEMYPGWRVRVNGRQEGIGVEQGVFRVVKLPAGVSTVEFTYDPSSFRIGLYLMMLALSCAAALATLGFRAAKS